MSSSPTDASSLPAPASRPFALMGAPTEAGSNAAGGCMGPAALRVAGLQETLQALGHRVEDFGDISFTANGGPSVAPATPGGGLARNWPEIRAGSARLGRRAYELLEDGYCPIFLGGDHSISIGTLNGISRWCDVQGRPLFVIWLDAHADFNTPDTSPSGNLHGMPLAALCGHPALTDLLPPDPGPALKTHQVYLFGLRAVDAAEKRLLRENGVRVMDMRRIDERGVGALVDEIVTDVRAAGGHLHLSFDIDALDPTIAPAVGTDVPGGLSYREAHLLMEKLYDSGLVGSLDLVELNPFLDERGRSARLMVELVASLFGRRILE
ncbi:MAG: arginase [Burkholderiaceae bacterium]